MLNKINTLVNMYGLIVRYKLFYNILHSLLVYYTRTIIFKDSYQYSMELKTETVQIHTTEKTPDRMFILVNCDYHLFLPCTGIVKDLVNATHFGQNCPISQAVGNDIQPILNL